MQDAEAVGFKRLGSAYLPGSSFPHSPRKEISDSPPSFHSRPPVAFFSLHRTPNGLSTPLQPSCSTAAYQSFFSLLLAGFPPAPRVVFHTVSLLAQKGMNQTVRTRLRRKTVPCPLLGSNLCALLAELDDCGAWVRFARCVVWHALLFEKNFRKVFRDEESPLTLLQYPPVVFYWLLRRKCALVYVPQGRSFACSFATHLSL